MYLWHGRLYNIHSDDHVNFGVTPPLSGQHSGPQLFSPGSLQAVLRYLGYPPLPPLSIVSRVSGCPVRVTIRDLIPASLTSDRSTRRKHSQECIPLFLFLRIFLLVSSFSSFVKGQCHEMFDLYFWAPNKLAKMVSWIFFVLAKIFDFKFWKSRAQSKVTPHGQWFIHIRIE